MPVAGRLPEVGLGADGVEARGQEALQRLLVARLIPGLARRGVAGDERRDELDELVASLAHRRHDLLFEGRLQSAHGFSSLRREQGNAPGNGAGRREVDVRSGPASSMSAPAPRVRVRMIPSLECGVDMVGTGDPARRS